jgi:hypothetical protein
MKTSKILIASDSFEDKAQLDAYIPTIFGREQPCKIYLESFVCSNTISNVNRRNHFFEFTTAGVRQTCSLTIGCYDGDSLAVELQNKMLIPCVYNFDSSHFTWGQPVTFHCNEAVSKLLGVRSGSTTTESQRPADLMSVKMLQVFVDGLETNCLFNQEGEVLALRCGSIAHIPVSVPRFQVLHYNNIYPCKSDVITDINQLKISIRDQNKDVVEGLSDWCLVFVVENFQSREVKDEFSSKFFRPKLTTSVYPNSWSQSPGVAINP